MPGMSPAQTADLHRLLCQHSVLLSQASRCVPIANGTNQLTDMHHLQQKKRPSQLKQPKLHLHPPKFPSTMGWCTVPTTPSTAANPTGEKASSNRSKTRSAAGPACSPPRWVSHEPCRHTARISRATSQPTEKLPSTSGARLACSGLATESTLRKDSRLALAALLRGILLHAGKPLRAADASKGCGREIGETGCTKVRCIVLLSRSELTMEEEGGVLKPSRPILPPPLLEGHSWSLGGMGHVKSGQHLNSNVGSSGGKGEGC
eukprot:422391-Rhodomonas_salina.4